MSDPFSNFLEDSHVETSVAEFSHLSIVDQGMEHCTSPLADFKLFVDCFIVGIIQVGIVFIPECFNLLFSDTSFLHQFITVEFVDWRTLTNHLIHHRLGET